MYRQYGEHLALSPLGVERRLGKSGSGLLRGPACQWEPKTSTGNRELIQVAKCDLEDAVEQIMEVLNPLA